MQEKHSSGVPGLDEILSGGLPKGQIYLLQGKPGTGKTTLALQFLNEGVRLGEKVLYVTFSETMTELKTVIQSHGWEPGALVILELSAIATEIGSKSNTTLFHPSEIELSKTVDLLRKKVEELKPDRIVIDSVSELRLLADSSLKYRRQMLALKEFFIHHHATVLLLDDLTTEAGDLHVQSIVHGVLLLEKFRAAYGAERRQFHIVKLRGVPFRGGTHDYIIEKGGLRMFPRLVASDHSVPFKSETLASGVEALDCLVGGGFDRGTSNLILGPAGSGKSTIALRFALTAAQNGKCVSVYSFEESVQNLEGRAKALGLDIRPYIDSGNLVLRKVDPAELTPGQFATLLRTATDEHKADMVVIDSLNGYVHAMPEQQFLMLQLHELLAYLANNGVVTIMILAQAGIMGSMKSPLDLTYLADTVLITRFFEAFGRVKKAVSVIKKRTGAHEETLRELKIGQGGVMVGPVLEEFSGIFSGIPNFVGSAHKILKEDA
jgi:circadian clock protein KaiC